MKILINVEGKIDYDKIDDNSTVEDLLKAIDEFLENNPLSCCDCEESCCRKAWSVEVDNICVNRLCSWDRGAVLNYVQENLIEKKNFLRGFHQFVLSKEKSCFYIDGLNRCTIYEKRPLICRLYVCPDKSRRYNILREAVAGTYLNALILEYRIGMNDFSQKTIRKYKKNPAVFASGYSIPLIEIIKYVEEKGWLDGEEREILY